MFKYKFKCLFKYKLISRGGGKLKASKDRCDAVANSRQWQSGVVRHSWGVSDWIFKQTTRPFNPQKDFKLVFVPLSQLSSSSFFLWFLLLAVVVVVVAVYVVVTVVVLVVIVFLLLVVVVVVITDLFLFLTCFGEAAVVKRCLNIAFNVSSFNIS